VEKIEKNLILCATEGKSSRASNTIGELYMGKGESEMLNAAKYFKHSQDYGCMLGNHWMGIFQFQGQGVSKNVPEAFKCFKTAVKMGNCQSEFQLYNIYALIPEYKDPVKAYYHLENALKQGLTRFDDL
jgi:TPR repeat protein